MSDICPHATVLPELAVVGYDPVLRGCALQPTKYTKIEGQSLIDRNSYVSCTQRGYRDNYTRCTLYQRHKEVQNGS